MNEEAKKLLSQGAKLINEAIDFHSESLYELIKSGTLLKIPEIRRLLRRFAIEGLMKNYEEFGLEEDVAKEAIALLLKEARKEEK